MPAPFKFFILLLFCSALLPVMQAQRVDAVPDSVDSSRVDSSALVLPPSDTLPVFVFAERRKGKLLRVQDSVLQDNYLRYNPMRRQGEPFVDLGNLGSPAAPLSQARAFSSRPPGLNLGLNAFDVYHFEEDSVGFYERERAFTEARFSQGPTQEDLMIGLDFGRGFGPALRFSARYRRINNAGYFQHLKSFDDALAFGLHYLPPGGRYRAVAYFVHNENRQEDNGGIVAEQQDLFGNTVVAPPGQLEVKLSDAQTRLAQNRYVYSQYYGLSSNTRADSSSSGMLFKNGWYLHAKTSLETFEYKFYDKLENDDTLVFEPLDNLRGMRVFLRNFRFDQQLDVQWMRWPSDSSGVEVYALAGLYHQRNRLYFEPLDTFVGMTYALTTGHFSRGLWGLEWDAFLALAGEAGAYRADLRLRFWLFNFGIEAASRQPVYLAGRMYVTQQQVWSQDLANERYQRASLGLRLGRNLPDVDLRFTRLQQTVYFDSSLHPLQLDEEVLLAEAVVKSQFHWWRLHYDQETRFAMSSSEILPAPLLYTEQKLYFRGPLFKGSFEFMFGAELDLLSPYRLRAYHPLIGSFYVPPTEARDWQPFLHVFLGGRMQNIRFYFRLENVLPPFTGDYYYLTEGYPQPHLALRFGLSASFRN